MPPQGSRRRAGHGDGDGVDRLSVLPEELLLQILDRLGSAHEAVRTSILSSRWRGLWTGLLELTFRDVAMQSVEAALARLTGPALNLLAIEVKGRETPDRISSLLFAAARLAPKKLTITGLESEGDGTVDLPCLDRTASLKISTWDDVPLAPPPAGEFGALTNLWLGLCKVDPAALLPLCPNLRVLVWLCSVQIRRDTIIHLPSLEKLVLKAYLLHHIDITAPVLKKVQLELTVDGEINVSLSSPMVEHSDWYIIYEEIEVAFGQLWRLQSVRGLLVQGQLPHLQIHLHAFEPDLLHQEWSFEQAIAQLRMPNFYALGLLIFTEGHVFGPMVLHLLRIRPVIQRLQIVLVEEENTCSKLTHCPCKQPENWASESVALTDLQVVEIKCFSGKGHEVDFLKLLFRSATVLKRMTVRMSNGVSPSSRRYKKICSIFMEYPNVECVLYSNGTKWKNRKVGATEN